MKMPRQFSGEWMVFLVEDVGIAGFPHSKDKVEEMCGGAHT